jgi:hypothetical protein
MQGADGPLLPGGEKVARERRMRGIPKENSSFAPPHLPFGHLLPAGEKRDRAAAPRYQSLPSNSARLRALNVSKSNG